METSISKENASGYTKGVYCHSIYPYIEPHENNSVDGTEQNCVWAVPSNETRTAWSIRSVRRTVAVRPLCLFTPALTHPPLAQVFVRDYGFDQVGENAGETRIVVRYRGAM